jgi:hypothetical protein
VYYAVPSVQHIAKGIARPAQVRNQEAGALHLPCVSQPPGHNTALGGPVSYQQLCERSP